MTTGILSRKFFLRPTLEVAEDLLGTVLTTNIRGFRTAGLVVEVEAYCASGDPACHSFCGKTARNEVMFWQGGHCYVYLIYGMHYCVNVVTEGENIGAAVLIRALEPITGIDTMRRRRRYCPDANLTKGPARLCQALGISRSICGDDFLNSKRIRLYRALKVPARRIQHSRRIGISKAADYEWRFYIKDNPWVSR